MRIFIAAVTVALLSAAAQAQDHGHDQPHGLAHPAISKAHQAALDAQQHKQCQAMYKEMADQRPVDKHHGAAGSPTGKPLSAAEMKAMHDKCDAIMGKTSPAAPKP